MKKYYVNWSAEGILSNWGEARCRLSMSEASRHDKKGVLGAHVQELRCCEEPVWMVQH